MLGAEAYVFGAEGRDYADVDAMRAAGIEPIFVAPSPDQDLLRLEAVELLHTVGRNT